MPNEGCAFSCLEVRRLPGLRSCARDLRQLPLQCACVNLGCVAKPATTSLSSKPPTPVNDRLLWTDLYVCADLCVADFAVFSAFVLKIDCCLPCCLQRLILANSATTGGDATRKLHGSCGQHRSPLTGGGGATPGDHQDTPTPGHSCPCEAPGVPNLGHLHCW